MKECFSAVAFCCIMIIIRGPVFADTAKRSAAVSVSGEKIFICPIIDSSSLEKFEGWPSEKTDQALLLKNYQRMYRTMVVEFRRGEKYGLYEMAEDSTRATTMVSFAIQSYSFKKDTLTLPVRMTVRQKTDKKIHAEIFTGYGIYRAHSKPKSPFHYIDNLLADFRRNFPYKRAVGVFCPPLGKN